jgi:hypothetical protein
MSMAEDCLGTKAAGAKAVAEATKRAQAARENFMVDRERTE